MYQESVWKCFFSPLYPNFLISWPSTSYPLSLSLSIPQIGRYELPTRYRLLLARDTKEPISPFTFSIVKELLIYTALNNFFIIVLFSVLNCLTVLWSLHIKLHAMSNGVDAFIISYMSFSNVPFFNWLTSIHFHVPVIESRQNSYSNYDMFELFLTHLSHSQSQSQSQSCSFLTICRFLFIFFNILSI